MRTRQYQLLMRINRRSQAPCAGRRRARRRRIGRGRNGCHRSRVERLSIVRGGRVRVCGPGSGGPSPMCHGVSCFVMGTGGTLCDMSCDVMICMRAEHMLWPVRAWARLFHSVPRAIAFEDLRAGRMGWTEARRPRLLPIPLPVMPGLAPGISRRCFRRTAAWIPGTSPGMTEGAFGHDGGACPELVEGGVRA